MSMLRVFFGVAIFSLCARPVLLVETTVKNVSFRAAVELQSSLPQTLTVRFLVSRLEGAAPGTCRHRLGMEYAFELRAASQPLASPRG